jgi:hypothetical protein
MSLEPDTQEDSISESGLSQAMLSSTLESAPQMCVHIPRLELDPKALSKSQKSLSSQLSSDMMLHIGDLFQVSIDLFAELEYFESIYLGTKEYFSAFFSSLSRIQDRTDVIRETVKTLHENYFSLEDRPEWKIFNQASYSAFMHELETVQARITSAKELYTMYYKPILLEYAEVAYTTACGMIEYVLAGGEKTENLLPNLTNTVQVWNEILRLYSDSDQDDLKLFYEKCTNLCEMICEIYPEISIDQLD